MALASGTRLGPYQLGDLLGAGGMGEVYGARDTRLERDVAIKVLPHDAVADEGARHRLMREARLAARLNHPHICTIYDVGESDGLAYIAMERIEGRPLDALIGTRGLPVESVIRCGTQIAEALAFAHDHGVVHRDLKCSNVLVSADGRVKVLDFGLAKRFDAGGPAAGAEQTRTLTETGVVVGTPQYLAPEILRGGEADPRSDLWSVGVVLYEMASGGRPFRGATSIELSAAVLNDPPEPPPARVPAGLARIIERCLAKDPAQRYREAGEVRAALEALASDAGARRASFTAGAPGAAAAAPRRAWPWAAAVALILIVAAVWLDLGGVRTRWFPPAGPQRIRSLAVLPLDNFSRDPEQRYFADGMTDELITLLAQISSLRVTSRTSVMGFRGTTLPLPEIARKLGVDAIVEGSVQRSGDRVRVTAQLIRAASDEHMWAQTYERELRDVLAMQDEVAGAIAKEVRARLTPHEAEEIATSRAVSPRAYELYLRGLNAYHRWETPGTRSALEFLAQAVREDSTYAPAWAVMGLVYLDDPGEFGTRKEDEARGRQAIERALALDPDLGLAHAAKADILFQQEWNWEAAEREYRRAIELSPSLFEPHHQYSHLLMNLGRVNESFEQSKLALAVDPLSPAAVMHMGWYYLYTGDNARAIQFFEQTLHMDPSFSEAYRIQAAAFVLSHRFDEAHAAQQKAIELTGSADTTSRVVPLRSWLALNARIAAVQGRRGEAERMARELIAGVARDEQSAFDVATVYSELGMKDEAFEWLGRSVERREKYVLQMKQDPFLLPLRSDPRFRAMLKRIGLPG